MDVYLRRYFWVWILFTITLCAYFAARGTNGIIAANLMRPNQPGTRSARRFVPAATADAGDKMTTVVQKNIFCSSCAPAQLVDETDDGDGSQVQASSGACENLSRLNVDRNDGVRGGQSLVVRGDSR